MRGSSQRREAHEQRVDDPEDPRHATKLKPRAVANQPPKQRPEGDEAIVDGDLRVRALVSEVRGQRPGGRVVSFAEIGGKNEYSPRRRRRGLDAGLSRRGVERRDLPRYAPPPARDRHVRNLSVRPDERKAPAV